MKQPTTVPRITTIRKLVVYHQHIYFRDHVNHLSKWVRRITAQSHLEHLELAMDDLEYFRGPYSNYGGLVEHISHRHGQTIRVLRLTHGYVDLIAIALLCQKCPNLENVSLGVNMETLVRVTSNQFPSSHLTGTFLAARIPPKGRLVVKITTSRLPSMQHQGVQSPEHFHRRTRNRLLRGIEEHRSTVFDCELHQLGCKCRSSEICCPSHTGLTPISL